MMNFLSLALALLLSLGAPIASEDGTHTIVLSSVENEDGSYTHSAVFDGESVAEYNYTWHADPSTDHGEVKQSPAEYYTGTQPGNEAVYIAHDIVYYPELDASAFKQVRYGDDVEWAYYYTAEGYTDYIFSLLPVVNNSLPTEMMHSAEEAYTNAVLHITEPGTYRLEGDWNGQIYVDLGDEDETYVDPTAKVTLILNGVNVTCTVAPALIIDDVYECNNAWESAESYTKDADTSKAGANICIADDTENNLTGANVYRILRTQFKDEEAPAFGVREQKKQYKIDGACYAYQSMNIDGGEKGTGILNLTAGYEGIGTEMHLTINGGNLNIFADNDGINVNEDGVSVVTINGGSTHIMAGLGAEGDGIDSNDFLVINGGTVVSMANPIADSGMDSDCGTYVNGGTVIATGSTMDWAEADDTNDSTQVTMNLRFAAAQRADEAIILTDATGKVVFAYDADKDEVAGSAIRWYQGAIISCETLQIGETYSVYIGGDVFGEEKSGIYDVASVTGFSDDALQQGYADDEIGGMRPDMGGIPQGERPELPEGSMPGQPSGNPGEQFPAFPEGGMPGQPSDNPGEQFPAFPEGSMPGQPSGNVTVSPLPEESTPNEGGIPAFPGMPSTDADMSQPQIPTRPDGMSGITPGQTGDARPELPEGVDPTQWPNRPEMGGMTGGESAACQTTPAFTMTDKVNNFSGVRDYAEHSLVEVAATATTDAHYVCSVCGAAFADAEGKTAIEAANP